MEITLEKITDMLLEDRLLARENGQVMAAIEAATRVARFNGFQLDQPRVDRPAPLMIEDKREAVVPFDEMADIYGAAAAKAVGDQG